jgi:hypothetical protein
MRTDRVKVQRRRACVVTLAGVALAALVLLLFPSLVYVPFHLALRRVMPRTGASPRDLQGAVMEIQAGHLVPGRAGVVTLPPEWRHFTQDGKAYVEYRPGGDLRIVFVTWRGKALNFEGYLYTSRGLTSHDIDVSPDAKEAGPGSLGSMSVLIPFDPMALPTPSPTWGDDPYLPVTVERKVDQHWYMVSWRMD